MLGKGDLKEIGKLLDPVKKMLGQHTGKLDEQSEKLKELDKKLSINTSSVIKIEGKIGTALELRKDVAQVREQVKDHEERITSLEI